MLPGLRREINNSEYETIKALMWRDTTREMHHGDGVFMRRKAGNRVDWMALGGPLLSAGAHCTPVFGHWCPGAGA